MEAAATNYGLRRPKYLQRQERLISSWAPKTARLERAWHELCGLLLPASLVASTLEEVKMITSLFHNECVQQL